MIKRIYLIGIILSFMSSTRVSAQSTLPLQQQCAAGATHLVERLDSVVASTSHYNKKLDQCFARVGFYLGQIEETVEIGNGKMITLKHPHWMVTLYRVFDDKILGSCAYIGASKQECWIDKATPRTIDEFEVLLASYMEE